MRFLLVILTFAARLLLAEEKAAVPATKPGSDQSAPKQKYTKEYQMLVIEAMRSFQVHDYKTALALADKADTFLPPTALTLNVRGAVAIEMRQFEEGLKYCQQALKLDPKFFPARFNICEIPFQQGRYEEARTHWQALYENYRTDYPNFAREDEMPELLIYRIVICYLLEKDMVHAKDWLEKIPFPSITPAYQYAHAAYEHEQGNTAKWEEWLRDAAFIWPDNKRSNFTDVLVQLKWLKDESAAPAAKDVEKK